MNEYVCETCRHRRGWEWDTYMGCLRFRCSVRLTNTDKVMRRHDDPRRDCGDYEGMGS